MTKSGISTKTRRVQFNAQAPGTPSFGMSSTSPDPTGNRAERRAWAKRTKSAMPKPMPKPFGVEDVARMFDVPVSLLMDPAPEPAAPEPATDGVGGDRIQAPLSDDTRATFTALAARTQMPPDDDPDGLVADIRQRALDRLHGQETPECGHRHAGQTCTRPADHTARSERSRRHATACGTIRWES